ncbi:glutamyl-tRNA reductase [Lentilactobacillus diolivorans]|uniref:glutamyl-tRNA reductase n=1 Tax=Lentilactobacillus diolivorans TaxID=179838 RepID=UPI002468C189|nr:glutamyl-tRNA reductase [Lentilactobacillus diolivorans]MDH5105162.1 glutamyl-tRNA reductase [Lentilactobacillus diolivorans]
MFIIYVSLNYQKLPIDIREKFVLSKDELVQANRLLNEEKSILENVILSTCNRTDVYAVVDQIHTGRYYIKRFLANWFHMDLDQINRWVEIGTKEVAVTHLMRVSTGLESLIVGEPQILGQVKDAFFLARDNQTTGAILDHLFKQAITFSKKMHTDYRVSELAQTSGQVGLHQIKQTLGSVDGKRLAIVGLGEVGDHVLKNASTMGFGQILILNHHDSKAIEQADQYPEMIDARPWRQLLATLNQSDAVVMATSSKQALLSGDAIANTSALKIIIDLGVPRNVAKAGLPDQVRYYDIDHITGIIAENKIEKQQMLNKIADQVPAAVQDFYVWQKQLHVVPVIRQLRESSLNVEKVVYDSLLRKLPDLDAHQRKVISKHMKSIINQMIKGPIKEIKELSVQDGANADLRFFCDIFGLSFDEIISQQRSSKKEESKQSQDATREVQKVYEK